jgi:hypothetical protein
MTKTRDVNETKMAKFSVRLDWDLIGASRRRMWVPAHGLHFPKVVQPYQSYLVDDAFALVCDDRGLTVVASAPTRPE